MILRDLQPKKDVKGGGHSSFFGGTEYFAPRAPVKSEVSSVNYRRVMKILLAILIFIGCMFIGFLPQLIHMR